MLNVLVTGGAGNVGSSTVGALLKTRDVNVVVVDDLSTGTLAKLPHQGDPLFRFVKTLCIHFSVNYCFSILSRILPVCTFLHLLKHISFFRQFDEQHFRSV